MPSPGIRRIPCVVENDEAGFSLLEAIVATGLMAGALASLGQMLAISVANNRLARAGSEATVLAQQKMEQLRGLTWGFDTLGLPISDTTTDTARPDETPTGGTGLSVSPAGTLRSNVDGWVDYVDSSGLPLGSGAEVPNGTVYIRRWAIEPLPSSPTDTVVIHVLVTPLISHHQAAPGARERGEARLMCIRTRKSQ